MSHSSNDVFGKVSVSVSPYGVYLLSYQEGGIFQPPTTVTIPIKFEGSTITQEFFADQPNGLTLKGVEPDGTGGFSAVLFDSDGNFFYWTLDAEGNITGGDSLSETTVTLAETTFDQDLNGDGAVLFRSTSDGSYTSGTEVIDFGGEGGAALYENDDLGFVVEDFDAYDGYGAAYQITFNGEAVDSTTFPGYDVLGVEANGTGGYSVVLKETDANGGFAYWTLDGTGAITGGGSLTDAQVALAEVTFQQDLNGDGAIITPAISNGSVTVENDGSVRLFDDPDLGFVIRDVRAFDGRGSASQITFNGESINSTTFPAYNVLGTESDGNGSYVAVLEETDADGGFAYWTLDGTGAITGGGTLSEDQVILAETTFNQDLNGDGAILFRSTSDGSLVTGTTLIEANGGYDFRSSSVALYESDTLGFAIEDSRAYDFNGAAYQITFNGESVNSTTFLNYNVLGVEANSVGGYSVVLKETNTDGGFAYWTLDATGAIVGGGNLSDGQVALEEYNFGQDFNNDGFIISEAFNNGTIARLDQFSNVFLFDEPDLGFWAADVSGYFDQDQTSNNYGFFQITYNGESLGSTSAVLGNYSVIGIENNDAGYGAVLRDTEGNFAYWQLDASGAITAGGELDFATVINAEKSVFKQDLNGDGLIGNQIVGGGVLENAGIVSLNEYVLGVGFFDNIAYEQKQITFAGNSITLDENGLYAGFDLVGIEANSSGYGVVLRDDATGDFAAWQLDSTGAITSGFDLSIKDVLAAEALVFQQDLDGDGALAQVGTDGADAIAGAGGEFEVIVGLGGADTLTGFATFVQYRYLDISDAGDVITNFSSNGSDEIRIDDLLKAAGFTTTEIDSDLVDSGVVKFGTTSGVDLTVSIDLDGSTGSGAAVTLATLNNQGANINNFFYSNGSVFSGVA